MTLRMERVAYRYAGTAEPALTDVDLSVEVGEIVAVVGANDSGKSTLALVASGLAPRTIGGHLSGTVTIDDVTTAEAPSHELAQRCGIVFQNPAAQLSGTAATVYEEVAFGPRNLALAEPEVVRRVEWAMVAVGVDHLAPKDPGRLSGGEGQLVALASVLAMRPRYVVLDEPTSQLDPHGTRQVGEALAGLAASNDFGILLVEHKTDLVVGLADRVVVLDAGRVAVTGRAADVLGDEAITSRGVAPPARMRLGRAVKDAGLSVELPDA